MARADAAIFPRELLHDCLTRALNEGATITDEASALEYCGFHPQLVEGRADNIKVTRRRIWRWPNFTSPEPSIRRIHNANWTRF